MDRQQKINKVLVEISLRIYRPKIRRRCKKMLPFLVILPLVVHSCSAYSYGQPSEGNRFSLRKLLENLDVTSNFMSAANMSNVTTSGPSLLPEAILQIVDEQGLVIDRATTNQNIRLKVKALTSPEYQSPFIKKCWYDEYDVMPDGETKPLKTEIFVEKGCVEQKSNLLKTTAVPFEENGVLEAQTNLFNLMPLYNDKFSVLVVHCEIMLCRTNVTCIVTCSERRKTWKMDRSADTLELSVAVEVEKKKQTPTERKAKEKPDISDFLISGGRQPPDPRLRASTEAPFLQRYQPYFTVSTLGVLVLLLLCVIGIGYMFISYKNNKKYDNVSSSEAYYTNNKLTGIKDVGDVNHQAGGISTKQQLTSPPPAYTHASAWIDADQRLRSPYRNPCIGTPHEGVVLEARQLCRDNIDAGRLQELVNRRQSDEAHGVFRYEGGTGGAQSNLYSGWNESPQRYRESVNVPTSPVGGEFYPAQTRRSRSPSSDRLLPMSPVREPGNESLIRAALLDYFEKYGM